MAKCIQFLLAASVLFIGAHHSFAQEHCTRHVEQQGGFSICLPDGWDVRERPNQKYRVLFGPVSDSFAPNVNFKDQISTLALQDYVTSETKNILARKADLGMDSIDLVSQSNFTTASGLRGLRAVFVSLYKGFSVRTIQYYFDVGNDRKLIVTGTSLEKNKEVFDGVFDRVAKSFRMN